MVRREHAAEGQPDRAGEHWLLRRRNREEVIGVLRQAALQHALWRLEGQTTLRALPGSCQQQRQDSSGGNYERYHGRAA